MKRQTVHGVPRQNRRTSEFQDSSPDPWIHSWSFFAIVTGMRTSHPAMTGARLLVRVLREDRTACLVAPLSLLVAAGVSGFAQTFRGGVDVVQLDVSVLDTSRRPVHGLADRDFTVLIDGQPRRIV